MYGRFRKCGILFFSGNFVVTETCQNLLNRPYIGSFMSLHCPFKGTVSRDFRPLVFFTNQPHLGLKPFRIWLCIRRENRHYSSFSGVNYTAETVSTVSITPLKPFLRCQWHRWNCFSGVIDTAETLDLILIAVSAVSLTSLKPFQRCHWYRGNRFSGINDTA
jgi:hypothetical protein